MSHGYYSWENNITYTLYSYLYKSNYKPLQYFKFRNYDGISISNECSTTFPKCKSKNDTIIVFFIHSNMHMAQYKYFPLRNFRFTKYIAIIVIPIIETQRICTIFLDALRIPHPLNMTEFMHFPWQICEIPIHEPQRICTIFTQWKTFPFINHDGIIVVLIRWPPRNCSNIHSLTSNFHEGIKVFLIE